MFWWEERGDFQIDHLKQPLEMFMMKQPLEMFIMSAHNTFFEVHGWEWLKHTSISQLHDRLIIIKWNAFSQSCINCWYIILGVITFFYVKIFFASNSCLQFCNLPQYRRLYALTQNLIYITFTHSHILQHTTFTHVKGRIKTPICLALFCDELLFQFDSFLWWIIVSIRFIFILLLYTM